MLGLVVLRKILGLTLNVEKGCRLGPMILRRVVGLDKYGGAGLRIILHLWLTQLAPKRNRK
jgi:hypothetical protein